MDKISKSVEALQGKLHAWLSIKVKINNFNSLPV